MKLDGALYLLPVWLGDGGGPELLPPVNIAVAERVKLFFCEHERTARRMLRRMSAAIDLGALELLVLDKDTPAADLDAYARLLGTQDAAIISEAGMPCIADPGARLVAAAHRKGVRVVPLTGPSSLFLALAASGLNGQQFVFHGYLPREPAARRAQLKKLEQHAQQSGAAQLFIETPYRNEVLLQALLEHLQHNTRLSVSSGLTLPTARTHSRPVKFWRQQPHGPDKHTPAVFAIGR